MPVVDELVTRIKVTGAEAALAADDAIGGLLDTWVNLSAVIAAGVGILAGGTIAFAAGADAKIKDARGVQLQVEKYTALQEALSYVGIEGTQTKGVVRKLLKVMNDAALGTKAAVDMFDELGISQTDLADAAEDPLAILPKIFEGVENLGTAAAKTTYLADIFGRSAGPMMANALDAGTEAILESMEAAKRWGLTIDEDVGRSSERLGDSMARINARARGVSNTFFREIVPSAEKVSTRVEALLDLHLDRVLDLAAYAGERLSAALDSTATPLGRFVSVLLIGGGIAAAVRMSGALAGIAASGGAIPSALLAAGSAIATGAGAALLAAVPWLILALAVDDVVGSLTGRRGLTTALAEAAGADEEFKTFAGGLGVAAEGAGESLAFLATQMLSVADVAIPGLKSAILENMPTFERFREMAYVTTGIPLTARDLAHAGTTLAKRGATATGNVARESALAAGMTINEANAAGQKAYAEQRLQALGINAEITITDASFPEETAAEIRRQLEQLVAEANGE